jgi:hypothetical protein
MLHLVGQLLIQISDAQNHKHKHKHKMPPLRVLLRNSILKNVVHFLREYF